MVLEHVEIKIAPGLIESYQQAFEEARTQVQCQPGCKSCRLLPSLDHPGQFLLLIEWETKEHHTEGFRKSPEYQEWSRLLHPFYDQLPEVRYYLMGRGNLRE